MAGRECEGCKKGGADMVCPTCLEKGIEPSYFCGQVCFKAAWKAHKAKHSAPPATQFTVPSMTREDLESFPFSGPLRPHLLSARRSVPPRIPRPDYADHPEGRSMSEEAANAGGRHIPAPTPADIEAIRRACRVGREVLEVAMAAVAPGVTTDEIDRRVHEACCERGAYPSPLNYYLYPKSVCTSVNEVVCHGIPDARPLESGDIVNLDVSVYIGGVHSDLNETVFVGPTVSAKDFKLVDTAYASLMAGIGVVKPKALYRSVGAAIEAAATAAGCSVVRTYCGHGVGRLFHGAPTIPHYARNKAPGAMEVGHIFTIEPMINAGDFGDFTWPDKWTAVTRDGQKSAQFEHTLMVTAGGCEILTARASGKPFYREQIDSGAVSIAG